jgi:hypothetical protein
MIDPWRRKPSNDESTKVAILRMKKQWAMRWLFPQFSTAIVNGLQL